MIPAAKTIPIQMPTDATTSDVVELDGRVAWALPALGMGATVCVAHDGSQEMGRQYAAARSSYRQTPSTLWLVPDSPSAPPPLS
jgi:hypothetical protein